MPLPAAALISAGASLVGQAINAGSTGNQNKKNRQFTEYMYNKQKQDNLDFWNMQNSYNSPEQEMARLLKAGLNPNLVYGNGAATSNAGAIQTPHAQPYRGEAPQFNLSEPVEGYFNAVSQLETLSNQKKQGTILDAQKALMDADLVSKTFDNVYKVDTQHIKRAGDAAKANYTQQLYDSKLQEYNLKADMMDVIKAQMIATKDAVQKDNTIRDKRGKLMDIDFDINSIRSRMSRDQYRSSMKGMTMQDWLKLLLTGTGQILRR